MNITNVLDLASVFGSRIATLGPKLIPNDVDLLGVQQCSLPPHVSLKSWVEADIASPWHKVKSKFAYSLIIYVFADSK